MTQKETDLLTDQQGNIMIMILFAGCLIMILGGGLISHFAVSEATAIERNLAEIRIHWAFMGELGYLLSHGRKLGDDGLIDDGDGSGFIDDLDKISHLETAYKDLPTVQMGSAIIVDSVSGDRSIHQWHYPENGDEYVLDITYTDDAGTSLIVDQTAFGNSADDDGRLKITVRIADSTQPSQLAALGGIKTRIPHMTVHLCMGDDVNNAGVGVGDVCDMDHDSLPDCETTNTDVFNPPVCEGGDDNDGSHSDGVSKIERLFYEQL